MRQILTLLLFITWGQVAYAQVLPPNLICINNDTLIWQIPNNPCGNFINYVVFSSQNINGPYNLIATITNQNQTSYYDVNGATGTWYYFMHSNFDCPGQPIPTSDTLNNEPLGVAVINTATVQGSDVAITWQPSASVQATTYIIYKNTAIGTIAIDTVDNTTTFVDTNVNPAQRPETYYVNALDACGNTSIFDTPHTTIHLAKLPSDSCDEFIALQWNIYSGWNNTGGLQQQEIWLSINNQPAVPIDTLTANESQYTYEGINTSTKYCFTIRAIKQNSSIYAESNQICVTPTIKQPMSFILLKNASVDANNQVVVTWQWGATASLQSAEVQSSRSNANYTTLNTQSYQGVSLVGENDFLDIENNPSTGSVFYKIKTVDVCGREQISNYASTIHLTGYAHDETRINTVTWTPLTIEGAAVTGYRLYRIKAGVTTLLTNVGNTVFTYDDTIDALNSDDSQICYYVIADGAINYPDGTHELLDTRSNTICIQQKVVVLLPNAFAPTGKNQEFKPLLVFGESAQFSMQIYDRWGQQIFQTTDVEKGWNGKRDGNYMNQGIYTYFIRVIQTDGAVFEKTGTVMLIR